MSTATIETISRLYETQRETRVQLLRARHEPFRQFSLRLQKMVKSMRLTGNEEVMAASLRILRRYRFDMCAAPVGFGNPFIVSDEMLIRLDAFAEEYQTLYPAQSGAFLDLVDQLRKLVALNDNPLLAEIFGRLESYSQVAIALKESRHIKVLEEILAVNGMDQRIRVVSQHQLRRVDSCFERLFLIGAAGWFPDFLFRAPRAPETFVVSYSWLGGKLSRPKPAFDGWERISSAYRYKPSTVVVTEPSGPEATSEVDDISDEVASDEVVPQISLPAVMKAASRSIGQPEEQIIIAARLCRLENGRGVFVEDREGARSLVIDLDEEDRSKVKRVAAAQLRPGMFLIVRSDEDDETDYIVPLANVILGARAESLRKFQMTWKQKLRSAVKLHGITAVIRTLRTKGSIRASEVNVSNWMSQRNIRTEDERDFNAIMNLIGWDSEADKCWQFSGEIDRAHRRAGRLVRKRLMKLVNDSDLTELERLGHMSFELGEVGARPLLAVRLLEISDDNIGVSQSRLHRPFELPE
jgi:hypothetical protein